MAYYITGDCHGDFNKLIWFGRFNELTKDDVIILLGDVALNYYCDIRDKKRKKLLAEFPCTFLCIHGNHEERPFNIAEYCEIQWKEGIVYCEPEFPNILFAKDGEIYDFDGNKAIAIGGAYSVDKEYRLIVGAHWFCDEQPSDTIKMNVEKRLDLAGWKVDYILSHTCPLMYEPRDLFITSIDQSKVDKSTEEWLSSIASKLEYKKWYFGHFHENRDYQDAVMLFEEIRELGKESFVQKIGRPKYKKGEMVLFYIKDNGVEHECYGRISWIDEMGTMGQPRETSYDVEGPDYRDETKTMLYKHICESRLQSMNDLMKKS